MMESTTSTAALTPRDSSSSPPRPSSIRPGSVTRTGSPPWTQIVRGMESDPVGGGDQQFQPLIGNQKNPTALDDPSESIEEGSKIKKQAWNKKPSSNGSIEGGGGSGSGGGGVLMGDELWPALSDSTKASPKLSSSDSLKNLSDFVPPIIPQLLKARPRCDALKAPRLAPRCEALALHELKSGARTLPFVTLVWEAPIEFFKDAHFAKFLNLISQIDIDKSLKRGIGMASSPSASQPQSPSSSLLPTMQLQSPSQSTVTSPKPNTNANHYPNLDHGRPARQKSMKRDGGGNAMANGGFSHQLSTGESSHNHNSNVKSGSGGGYEASSRDNHGNRDGSFRNTGGDHPPQRRNSFRRGNGEPHSRGDGSYQNYGGRRGDSDRGNHDWNHQRSFNGRDGPMQPRVSPRSYVRTPPVSAPFVPPAPVAVQPYMNPMGIPDMPVVYFSPTVPFGPPLSAPLYFAAPDPQLTARIVNQIDYYFSNENLIKDTYLRQNMDENGWVSVVLIAGFKKVKQLTENIQLILEAVQSSSVVEAQGDKIRKRGDWKRWIMPTSVKFQNAPGLQSPTSPNVATLCADIQSVMLDEKASGVDAEASSRSSGDLNSFLQATKGTSSVGC